jgi:hypothetical protein
LDLVGLLAVGRADVEVKAVLDRLALGHAGERQRWRHRAAVVAVAVPVPGSCRGADRDETVFFLPDLVAEDQAPEAARAAGSAQSIASSVNVLVMLGPPGSVGVAGPGPRIPGPLAVGLDPALVAFAADS